MKKYTATKSTATEIFAASILGTTAYTNGAKRIPHYDAELRALMVGKKVGEGTDLLQSWIINYDMAATRAARETLNC